jgi:GNAT superfamily N-acetyltransferase
MWGVGNKAVKLEKIFKEEMENELQKLLKSSSVVVSFKGESDYHLRVTGSISSAYGNYKLFTFNLHCYPGTCGILISEHTNVNPEYRNRGVGSKLMEFKIKIAGCMEKYDGYNEVMGFTELQCVTVDPKDSYIYKYEERILNKFGFKLLQTFVNQRGDNTCKLWSKNVRE